MVDHSGFYLDEMGGGYVQILKSEIWKWIRAKQQLPHARGAARRLPTARLGPYGPHIGQYGPH